MSAGRDTGGPVHPSQHWIQRGVIHREGGMTLRDHFAGVALQGLVGSPRLASDAPSEAIAFLAYSLADAMLKARLA